MTEETTPSSEGAPRKRVMPNVKELLRGESPTARHLAKQAVALRLVHRFGASTDELICFAVGQKAKGFGPKLADAGLLRASKTAAGRWSRDVAKNIFTLTEAGLELASRDEPNYFHYPEIDPLAVDQKKLRHDLIAQQHLLAHLWIGRHSSDLQAPDMPIGETLPTDYATERMLVREGDKSGVKRPDAVWIWADGTKRAIEIELSAKWHVDLHEFVYRVVMSLNVPNRHLGQFDSFTIYSESQAIHERYKAAFAIGTKYPMYLRNKVSKRREVSGHFAVHDWVEGRIHHVYRTDHKPRQFA